MRNIFQLIGLSGILNRGASTNHNRILTSIVPVTYLASLWCMVFQLIICVSGSMGVIAGKSPT